MGFNSTIITKKKMLRCGHFSYNFSKGRCKQCATIEDSLIRLNKEEERVEDDLSDLIKSCDGLFSKYIRLKYSDASGNLKCYTCDTVKHYTQMQCGHYIGRANMFLRFDETRNCRPQCEYCNCHKHGNLLVFASNLEKEHAGVTDILYEESRIVYRFTRDELKQLKISFKNKINAIQAKR